MQGFDIETCTSIPSIQNARILTLSVPAHIFTGESSPDGDVDRLSHHHQHQQDGDGGGGVSSSGRAPSTHRVVSDGSKTPAGDDSLVI